MKTGITAILTLSLWVPSAHSDEVPWGQWQAKWKEIQNNVQRSWKGKIEECSEKIHDYWTENERQWQSSWDDIKTKPAEIWRNQIDPQETYTEEVVEAARDPRTAERILKVALSGDGKQLVAEKLRFLPMYDPYTEKVRTLESLGRDLASRNSDYLRGSAFAADPVASCTLAAMLDVKFLWNEKILRTESGEWVSVREAIEGAANKAVGIQLNSLHVQAQKAMAAGKPDQCARLLGEFSEIVETENARVARASQTNTTAENPPATASRRPRSVIAELEADPAGLLRRAADFKRVGKGYRANQNYRSIVESYPHSGFADDALLNLAEDDYANLRYDECISKLNTLLERYYRSDDCDNALSLLGDCYLARVVPTDARRMAAIRNYKQILAKYEDGSRNWKAEVIELVFNKQKAIECYGLLLDAFPDSPYAARAKKKLTELEDD
ncbi:MAG: outer membrane protein assembly factor BamD [Planctomycetota bacterium]|jgi:TolA-binding protein